MLGVGAAAFDAARVLVYSYCIPAKSLFTEHLARNTTCNTTCDYIGRVRTPNRPDTGRTLTCNIYTLQIIFFLKLFSYFIQSLSSFFLFSYTQSCRKTKHINYNITPGLKKRNFLKPKSAFRISLETAYTMQYCYR